MNEPKLKKKIKKQDFFFQAKSILNIQEFVQFTQTKHSIF